MKRVFSICLIIFLVSAGCRAASRLPATPTPTTTATVRPTSTVTALTPSRTAPAQTEAAPTVTITTRPETLSCVNAPATNSLIQQVTAESWLDWVEKLSGAEPVVINGEETMITTRYSPAMFEQPESSAFAFVLETIAGWYPEEQIEVMDYTVRDSSGTAYTWQNLILTLPGTEKPDEIIILSAHLDSTSDKEPYEVAPGAEDNASGSAALLEAARIFADVKFARTLRIIWFTGEEQGLLGSSRYVDRLTNDGSILGVVNLDMFGYDSDNDRCFEMHVGTLPESDQVGQCFLQSVAAYDIPLLQYDYLTDLATDRSDHGSFWEAEIGAIEILENMGDEGLANGCSNGDPNQNYHSEGDTVDKINPESGQWIVRAALATAASMAEILP